MALKTLDAKARWKRLEFMILQFMGIFAQVEALLKLNPELVDAIDEYGFTPLHGVVGRSRDAENTHSWPRRSIVNDFHARGSISQPYEDIPA